MTKEEWLNKFDSSRKYIEQTCRPELFKSMDGWAEQQCIAFANFIAQHNYKPHDIDTWDEGRKNTHEVYDDFIEFQRLEQQNKP